MNSFSLPQNFTPRDYQLPLVRYLQDGGRHAVGVWHRRAGKDLVLGHTEISLAMERVGMYWHALPTYAQAKKAIWHGFRSDSVRVLDNLFPKELIRKKNDSELLIELVNGSMWQLVGSDNIDSLVGSGPCHVTFSEFALCRPMSWDLVRPILRENKGSAAFIFTPRGRNHAYKLYQNAKRDSKAFCQVLTILDTKALPPETLQLELDAGMPEALVDQEYLCDFNAALVGSIFGGPFGKLEGDGRTEEFPHENDRVHTTWDLGRADSTAIWFWRVRGAGVEVIDYYQKSGESFEHFKEVIEGTNLVGRRRNYSYAKHWLPHDARAKTFASGVSAMERFLEAFGSSKVAIVPGLTIFDGITAGRSLLLRPETRFHPRCGEGFDVLRDYHYAFDEDTRTYSKRPEHSWSSHGGDAWRYVGVVAKTAGILEKPKEPAKVIDMKARTLGQMCLNDLWKIREQREAEGR